MIAIPRWPYFVPSYYYSTSYTYKRQKIETAQNVPLSPPSGNDEMDAVAGAVAALISMPSADSPTSNNKHLPSPMGSAATVGPTHNRSLSNQAHVCLPEGAARVPPEVLFTPVTYRPSRTNEMVDLPNTSLNMTNVSSSEQNKEESNSSPTVAWYPGSISLSLPGDDDVLSPLHCFMRRYCVEAFAATPEDVSTPRYGKSHAGKIAIGQVGIRCIHCKHLSPDSRPERAVCFPSTLRNIYHSIETWQRRHSLVCTEIPPWVKKSIADLMKSSRTTAGGRRQYWEDAAKKLGLADTPQGVRFIRTPGVEIAASRPPTAISTASTSTANRSVVVPEDKELVTDYLYLLMEQMQVCYFTEEDRTGGRSKVKNFEVGFPGMQCQHCEGKAGFGRYFPASLAALALANSDRNIYNHLQKCRRCPMDIQDLLKALRKAAESSKNKRGSRKLFFERVWKRIHPSG
jgi:hypothetical protein